MQGPAQGLLCYGGRGSEEPYPHSGCKKDDCSFVFFPAFCPAYNPRLLEIITGDGNDCWRFDLDRLKGVGGV
jgi:hypothetical protein